MATILWRHDATPFLLADASDTLGEILRAAGEQGLEWVIVDREQRMFFYAYRAEELAAFVSDFPDTERVSALEARDLREGYASPTVPAEGQPIGVPDDGGQAPYHPSMTPEDRHRSARSSPCPTSRLTWSTFSN